MASANVNSQPVTLAITGASGSQYGLRLLECLVQAQRQVYLIISPAGRLVMRTELDLVLPARPANMECFFSERFGTELGQIRVFGQRQWTAPVASGSNLPHAMVICPCTTGTLGSISAGLSGNLLERAASVMLKERRRLILVVRETPLSALHLENMLRLAHAGVIIMPAAPGFYFRPQKIEDLVDFIVARVLDQLGVDHALAPKWGDA